MHDLAFLRFESGGFHSDEVLANFNRRENKVSFLVRLCNAGHFFALDQSYARFWNNRAERIDNLAPDRARRTGPCGPCP